MCFALALGHRENSVVAFDSLQPRQCWHLTHKVNDFNGDTCSSPKLKMEMYNWLLSGFLFFFTIVYFPIVRVI